MVKSFILGVLTIVIALFFVSETVQAGWLDNWYSQRIGSGPDYYKGQQRSYFSAGSFSVRTPTGSDHLVTISKPRLNVGCGGIDLFLGSFGFLNFEYLVQKLQRMIQAAPYIAFQLALKTISEKLGGIIEAAEAIVDKLNALQLNECQILRGFSMKLSDTGDITEALTEVANLTGLKDFYKAAKDAINPGEGGKTQGGATIESKKMIEGCSSSVQSLLSSLESNRGALAVVAQKRGYNDGNVISIVRGMIGDLVVKYDNTGLPQIELISPCDGVMQALEKKIILKRDSPTAECTREELTDFVKKVHDDLFSLKNVMENKSSLPNQGQLLKYSKTPLPVFAIVKAAALSKDSLLLDTLTEPIALGYIYQAVLELSTESVKDVEELYKSFMDYQKALENENQTKDPTKVCKVPTITQAMVQTLRENQYRSIDFFRKSYLSALNSISDAINIVDKIGKFYQLVLNDISMKFGAGVASGFIGR